MSSAAAALAFEARRAAAARAVLVCAGVGAAAALRTLAGGRLPAASFPAALLFAAALMALALAAGWRPRRDPRWRRSALLGAAGAAVLLGAWLSAGAALPLHAAQHLGALVAWTPVVTAVAVAEEVALRGALFSALLDRRGRPAAALAVSSLAFALLHVPLYGWQALPLDLAAGLFLGGLRLMTGGVTAPAAAHAIADLAAGWLA